MPPERFCMYKPPDNTKSRQAEPCGPTDFM